MVKKQTCGIWMGTDSVIVYIKTDYIYKNIAEDVATRFDTSNYKLDRPFIKGKNKKVITLVKDELGGKIITKFVGLRAKTYIYLKYDGSEDNKAKDTKKCIIKTKLKFENSKNYYKQLNIQNINNRSVWIWKNKFII